TLRSLLALSFSVTRNRFRDFLATSQDKHFVLCNFARQALRSLLSLSFSVTRNRSRDFLATSQDRMRLGKRNIAMAHFVSLIFIFGLFESKLSTFLKLR
ncbi:MAG: hypothetical protein J6V49_01110, partial [Bacteroidales bacterium]|nr:hypothetical protein [Bacteroidales bacterium]